MNVEKILGNHVHLMMNVVTLVVMMESVVERLLHHHLADAKMIQQHAQMGLITMVTDSLIAGIRFAGE